MTTPVSLTSKLKQIRHLGIQEKFYGYLNCCYTPSDRLFKIRVDPPQETLRSPFEHAVAAAKNIAERARELKKPLYLFMSGGADSEAMFQAFSKANVEFSVQIVRYEGGLNHFDIESAIKLCELKKVPYKIFSLNILEHYKKRWPFRYSILNGCQSPQFSVYMYITSQLNGFPVFAGNPPNILWDKHTQQHRIYLPKLREWSLQRHLDSLGGGVAFFFSYTSELTHSFLRSSAVKACILEKRSMSYWDKIKVYNSSGFRLLPRNEKYGGFERVKAIFRQRHAHQFHSCYDNVLRWNLDVLGPDLKYEVCAFNRHHLPLFLGGDAP